MSEFSAAIDRYVRSRDAGAYRRTARSVLARFEEWASARGDADFDVLGDDARGTTVMRRYAQRLARRVDAGAISASSAETYYNVVSGFLSYAVRDGELAANPAVRERAREALPSGTADETQQFWTPAVREQFLSWLDARIDESDDLSRARDRAFTYLLAYSGVRGAEVLRSSADDREGRQGLRWKRLDLSSGTLRVFGKAQEWETTALPRQARDPIRHYRALLDPPSPEWPVFPTDHAPTKYRAAREQLRERGVTDERIESLLESRPIDSVLRDHDVLPPSVTVDGMRTRLRTLCEQAGIDVNGEYLKLHAARRGIGDEIFRRDRGMAQDLLRHRSPQTTKEAYSHVDAEERSEALSELLEDG